MAVTWFNGKLTNENSLTLPAFSHPWLRGDGLFETLRTEGSKIYFLRRHLLRMQRSAEAIFFPKFDLERIRNACLEIATRINVTELGRLRIVLFSNEDLLITHQEYEIPSDKFNVGFYPGIRYSNSDFGALKSLSYQQSATALRWAANNGFQDCIFRNEKNQVVESALANILIEKAGCFYTPPLSSGCLPGIIREILLDGMCEISETELTSDDLLNSGVALLSSLREILIVTQVNGVLTSASPKLIDLATQFRNLAHSTPDY